MLGALIRKELLLHLLSYRYIVAFVILFGSVLTSVFVLATDHRKALENYRTNVAAHTSENRYAFGISGHFSEYETYDQRGLYSDRRPEDLGILARGLDDDLPRQVHVAGKHRRQVNERMYENPLFTRLPTPDLAHVLNVLASLLALVLAFDGISGERESGTLKLLMSHPVPRDLVLLGKWIGGYIPLAVAVLISFLAGMILLAAMDATALSSGRWIRIGVIVLSGLLYIALYFTLGLFISTLTSRSSTSLILSLFIWTVWVLALPNLIPELVSLISPAPTAAHLSAEKKAIEADARFKVWDLPWKDGPRAELEKKRDAINREAQARIARLDEYYHEHLRTQATTTKMLSRVSPSADLTYVLTGLAHTGPDLYRRFKTAYARFAQAFRAYGEIAKRRSEDAGDETDRVVFEELPHLEIENPKLRETIFAISFDLSLLILYPIVLFAATYLSFLRRDLL